MADEYTYDQVMTALRNADKAGDTQAATKLASIAQKLNTQKAEPKSSVTVEAAPKELAKGLKKEEAEAAKAKLEAAGAGVELK